MHTRCPHCQTTFAVNAAQLRAARGQVRCGGCRSVFDGVKCLIDDAPAEAPATRPDTVQARPDAGPGKFVDDKIAVAARGNRGPDFAPASPPVLAAATPAASDQIPEVLRGDVAGTRTAPVFSAGSLMLTTLALVLLTGLGGQFAWFNPSGLLAAYPDARPWLERFCAATGCSLSNRRDPSKIRMLARDVRVHPKYEGALLVSATLVNVAAHAQPYPRLRFSVFNVNGQTIASRTFAPKEYLSSDIDAAGEMLPGKPLQIAVELIAPEEAAVSYEFRFL